MPRLRSLFASAGAGVLLCFAATSVDACRQALVLGLDVSLSVNRFDFALQRSGLADALTDEAVMQALLAGPEQPVTLAVFEWSGQFNQTLLVDWTVIDSAATLQEIALVLREAPQGLRSGRTGLGAAMVYARDLLRQRPDCAVWTVDISGDGVNNNGVDPSRVRALMQAEDIGVNALVIEQPLVTPEPGTPSLSTYFAANVIVGPQAFAEVIHDFESYGAAIRRKLLRELEPVVGQAPRKTPRRLAQLP